MIKHCEKTSTQTLISSDEKTAVVQKAEHVESIEDAVNFLLATASEQLVGGTEAVIVHFPLNGVLCFYRNEIANGFKNESERFHCEVLTQQSKQPVLHANGSVTAELKPMKSGGDIVFKLTRKVG